jgi:hypothetical protein
MTTSIGGTTGITFNDASVQATAATGFGFKNRLINGDMVIDQRNAGASVTPTNLQYSVDRWQSVLTAASKYSLQRNAGAVTPPAGFTNYLGATSLSAYSVASGDAFAIVQGIEGFNVADLGWGTANAQTVTLSFWVRSSLTGAFGGSFYNSAATRSYPFSYTVSAANTWEQKTVTVAGDTAGTWTTDNTAGINVRFSLGAGATFSGTAGAWAAGNFVQPTGAVSVVGTSGATFYITGVQLEKGSTATSFDVRPYGTELALCQRYLPAYTGGVEMLGYWDGTNNAKIVAPFLVESRVAPTGVTTSGSFNIHAPGSGSPAAASIAFSRATTASARLTCDVASGGLSSANAAALNSAAGKILFTGCEL